MKKAFFGLLLLLFVIPTSVQASGAFDWVAFIPTLVGDSSTNARNDSRQHEITADSVNPRNDVLPCDFGFAFNYRSQKCEKVVVPEHGILNEGGISIRCEAGYKLVYEDKTDPGQARMTRCVKVVIPAHAQLSGTGDDFQCDRDFRRDGDLCVELKLPANSHIAAGGNDFDCNTGYTKTDSGQAGMTDGECVVATKPANAKFFPNSDDWYCENSYVKNGDKCEPLKVPSNGRASDTGTFFYCLPGHKLAANGRDCEQIKVPEHAQPNWLGSWTCEVGFKKVDDRCEKVDTVEHGKLLADSGFYCEPHFKRDEAERKCVEIVLPQNASWDDASLNDWRCNQGYVKKDDHCEVFKLPEHAFWLGFNSWDCDAGYKKVLDSGQWTTGRCEKVSIPDHAHASQSFEKWDCDSGYVKNYKENRCDSQ